jgi:hypothetical protein
MELLNFEWVADIQTASQMGCGIAWCRVPSPTPETPPRPSRLERGQRATDQGYQGASRHKALSSPIRDAHWGNQNLAPRPV